MVCDSCSNEHRIKTIENDLKRNSEQHREFYGRLEEAKTVDAVTQERYQQILATMSEIKSDIVLLKEKPSRRWDTIITAIITSGVGAFVGFLIGNWR